MMTAAFSPTPSAVLYVFAETLLGAMESCSVFVSQLFDLILKGAPYVYTQRLVEYIIYALRRTSNFEALQSIYIQLGVHNTALRMGFHGTSSHLT